MSPPGATEALIGRAEERIAPAPADTLFLPDFCDPRMVFGVVLVAELLALTFSLIRPADVGFLTDLARISMFMLWVGLTSASLLCVLKRPLSRLSVAATTLAVFALVLANIAVLSFATVWAGRWLGGGQALEMFPSAAWPFALRNGGIGLIVTAMLLRYFFVSHQWRLHVEAEARSRVEALQARIRPHFLFNSMNTIASLTRSNPAQAEEAVEDLADLFRATLGDAGRLLTLKEELELTRIYQRIESLRLGDRLHVDWQVGDLPMRAAIPGLTVQPLLENAICHGIEPLPDGGTVTIRGEVADGAICLTISNPLPRCSRNGARRGHRMALANIRERLRLAFDGRGSLDVAEADGRFDVTLRFPVTG